MDFSRRNNQTSSADRRYPQSAYRSQPYQEPAPVEHNIEQEYEEEDGFAFSLPLSWRSLEFEPVQISRRFYLVTSMLLVGIIAYALMTNSPIMAVTFILIGAVGYMYLEKQPEELNFSITTEGVTAGRDLYPWENIAWFSLVESSGWVYVSLQTRGSLVREVSIPLGEADPILVQAILRQFLKERPYSPTLVDTLGKLLHI